MVGMSITQYEIIEQPGEGRMGVFYTVLKFPASVSWEQMEFRGSRCFVAGPGRKTL